MTDQEIEREIERAQRNTRRLRALQAENDRTTANAQALTGAPQAPPTTPSPPITPYAVRG